MYISLGGNCSITYQLNKYKIRDFLSPFDWSKITINQLIKVFEDTLTNTHLNKYTNLTIKYKSDKSSKYRKCSPSLKPNCSIISQGVF
jgi:hypothetical protein